MDALSNCNSRTEFSIEISVVEADGSDGPTLVLESTRINGVDAGWIASGYEKQFEDCNNAIDCLRSRLSALPGVQRFMASHSTLVADSNHGAIVGDVLDERVRALISRQLEGKKLNKDEVERMKQDANKRAYNASSKVTTQESRLTKARAQVKKCREKLKEQVDARNPDHETKIDKARRDLFFSISDAVF